MKNLIKNTILVVVMVVLGLFLVGCDKTNVEPETPVVTTPTEGLVTIYTEADSVLVHIHTSKGQAEESEFKVYKNEPKNIKLKGFDPQTYQIWISINVYKDMYSSSIKPTSAKVIDHKNREVSYILNGTTLHYTSDFIYQLNYSFTFTK